MAFPRIVFYPYPTWLHANTKYVHRSTSRACDTVLAFSTPPKFGAKTAFPGKAGAPRPVSSLPWNNGHVLSVEALSWV